MGSTSASSAKNATFVTTQWTRVLEARGDSSDAKAALSDLCAAYYAPVFAFIRAQSPAKDSARDLTQEFFARILAGAGFATVDPQRGRFRSFLLGAVKHFLADMRDHSDRLKRGGGQPVESVETLVSGEDASTALQVADPHASSTDREFDRKWALTVLDHALVSLADEHKTVGKTSQFEALKPWLTGDTQNISQADVAGRLGLNEGTVKVAIHRLRRRFRELIKSEIARTLNDAAHVEEELSHLIEALA